MRDKLSFVTKLSLYLILKLEFCQSTVYLKLTEKYDFIFSCIFKKNFYFQSYKITQELGRINVSA